MVTLETLRNKWPTDPPSNPNLIINIFGDYEGANIHLLRSALLKVLDVANDVGGWVVVSGNKTIKLIGEMLLNEGRNLVDDEHDGLVCIAVAPLGLISDGDRSELIGV